ncbi:putative RNA dependent RNA polymerase [Oidiodendron maius ourmia-like virus 1]|uniref:RNA dependent RNA polymerase n=1 Tax=Oidiodendron maius ourmia-like virus 1 TaxID=2769355 RepID=A0ABX6SYG6_9VIRU|nr:putative RNA dependent RNA polymerase [Oidiodendron maius ourmia-like virus 1]QNN89181.1 putative RNA dependent RNA polymerase [Oidiodendron maius ourmia-like virus 1]
MVVVGRPRGACRVSMARTRRLVQRATTTWCQIFSRPVFDFVSSARTCTDLFKDVKKFLADCPSDDEAEVLAFQSIKKLLPPSCKCQEKDLILSLSELLSKPSGPLPSGYLAFVRRRVSSLFRKGWDVGLYDDRCRLVNANLSGTTDSPRREGGCLGAIHDHVELIDRVTGATEYSTTGVSAQIMVVQSAGKPRPLTKFSSNEVCLEPLHKTIYSRLSRTRWLCRGDPTSEKLARAGFRKGGTLVSGDYRSATDNLPLEVAELILDVILENSVSVPSSVKEHARRVLRPTLWNLDYDLEFEISRGQMMGSFLSFPLLCLQNFLCFEWARLEAGLEVMPLLINGDDILFETSCEEFPKRWMEVVGTLGLEVERTKTSVSTSYGSLNSTLFRWGEDDLLYVVPTLRFGMLAQTEFPNSLGVSFDSFVKGSPVDIRWRAARAFFSWHLATMKSVRAQPDELGFRGGLAFRMSRIFGLITNDCSVVALPRPPINHNVILSSDEISMVPAVEMSDELVELNNREMASWKFRVSFENLRLRASLRYCLALSRVRQPEICIPTRTTRSFLSDNFSWRRLRKRFFRPREGALGLIPVFDRVLLSQNTEDWEPPPPYGLEEWGGGDARDFSRPLPADDEKPERKKGAGLG